MTNHIRLIYSIISALMLQILFAATLSGCSEKKENNDVPTPEPTPDAPYLGSWCSDETGEDVQFICFYSDKAAYITTTQSLLKAHKYEEKTDMTYIYDSKSSKIYMSAQGQDSPMVVIYKTEWLEYDGKVFTRVSDSSVPTIKDNETQSNPSNAIVSTGDVVKNKGFKVTVAGSLKSVSNNDVAWFRFGCSPTLKGSRKSATLDLDSKNFEIELTGILDNETYYYQACVERNGVEYKGDIKKFKSDEKFFYTQQNRTYELITVKGGPYGDISVMQTELDPNHDFIFGDETIEVKYDTKGNFRDLLDKFMKATGLLWRMPTSEEWLFIAKGGLDPDDYKYSGSNDIDEVAWYQANSLGSAHVPAKKKPNKLGFYDMSGNRSEVVNDVQIPKIQEGYFVHSTEKPSTSIRDYPALFVEGYYGVAFGGDWSESAQNCTIYSYKNSGAEKSNQINTSKYTFRLIYSRQP